MNLFYILILFLFFNLPNSVYSQDTIKSYQKEYSIGKFSEDQKKYGLWVSYDSLGKVLQKQYFKKGRKNPLRIYKYEYNNNGAEWKVGKTKDYSGKTGTWKVYNAQKQLVRVEHYKFNRLHGVSRTFGKERLIRYKFGYSIDNRVNAKGKKFVYFYTVGMPSFADYTNATETYACVIVPIAGCMVSKKILRIQAVHNFFVNVRQSFRYGKDWKRMFFDAAK